MEALTLDERERIVDSALKIQSVRSSLELVGQHKIPAIEEIRACLKSVDHNLRAALGYIRSLKPEGTNSRRDPKDRVSSPWENVPDISRE